MTRSTAATIANTVTASQNHAMRPAEDGSARYSRTFSWWSWRSSRVCGQNGARMSPRTTRRDSAERHRSPWTGWEIRIGHGVRLHSA